MAVAVAKRAAACPPAQQQQQHQCGVVWCGVGVCSFRTGRGERVTAQEDS